MKKLILAGATNQTIDIFVQDSSATNGSGLTALVFNSAGLTCYYRKGATGTATALTLATQTVGGAHSDGGFVEIDSTNMPGMYRLDLSDTIVATAGSVTVFLHGATNMAPVTIELQVVSFDPEDAVRLGLTALPNAAADAAGGLPISDTGGLDLDAMNTNINDIETDTNELQGDWVNGGRLDLLIDAILADVTGLNGDSASNIADAILGRNIAGGSDGGRDVTSALRGIRNRRAISGGTLTVYEEDDSTSSWTAAVTTAAGDPVTEVDPT